MVYLDTSAAYPLFVPEDNSERIVCWLEGTAEPLLASAWTVTEFSSALALNQRQGKIAEQQAAVIWHEFRAFCEQGLRIVGVMQDDFAVGAEAVRAYRSGLRAGHALHLAVAQRLAVTSMATADAILARAAVGAGMQVIALQSD